VEVVAPPVLAGRYELGPVLGRGGMGEVRRAYDRSLRRQVAVKLFPRLESVRDRARFESEARAAAAVAHPNVVIVHDVGTEPVPFLVMELLPGGTLADALRRGPLPVARALDVMTDVLAGLGAAHSKGLIHRDVKPANVMFTADGRAKLADFGIATGLDSPTSTASGALAGTPAYVAPERLAGAPAGTGSDIYSVGVMLYETLAGTRPFVGDTPFAVAEAVRHERARHVCAVARQVSTHIGDVVMRAIARDPSVRFRSAAALSAALAAAAAAGTSVVTARLRVADAPTATVPVEALGIRGRRRYVRTWLLGGVALVVLLWGAHAASDNGGSSPAQPTPASNVATSVPVPVALDGPFADLEEAVRP
jgi:serine/threonine-protein kinase